jgi:hypothetical protein
MALDIQTVHARLNHARKLYRLSQAIRWVVSGLAVSGFIFLIALLGDIFFHYGSVARWIALTAVLIPFVAGCVIATLTTFRRVSPEAMARRIECTCDSSKNVLINAIQFDAELDPRSSLREAIFSEMQDPFPRVRWNELFDIPLLKKLFM